MFFFSHNAFWTTTVLKFMFGILCHHLITCYLCDDIYFKTVEFQLCHERCTECLLLYSCLKCENTLSGSSCRSICRADCNVLLIPNGTVFRFCNSNKTDCCINCYPFSLCSACVQILGGSCVRCKNNTYRNLTNCDQKCGHCVPNKNNEVICDIDTGHCQGDCLDGFYGQRCDRKCNGNCFDSQTNSTKCARDTGKCIFGCIAGRYNETCQNICSKYCLDEYCNQTSGTCKECLQGWYGDTCERQCSETCAYKACDQTTGSCLKGCIRGRYGNHCERICSQTCVNNTCHQISGQCENGCSNGWFGEKCDKLCSNMCFNRTCKQTLKHCENGCVPGSYGNNCNKECSSTCSKKTCDRSNGKCQFGCVNGWFGSLCNTSCSKTCVDISCEQATGVCNNGCIAGKFGEHCEKNCSESLFEKTCENYTVPCFSCESNFENGKSKNESTNKASMENLVIFVLVGFMIALLCFFIMYFIRQRVVLSRSSNLKEEMVMSKMNVKEESIYDEIEDINEIHGPSGETFTTGLDSTVSHLLKGRETNKQLEEKLNEKTVIIPLDEAVYNEAYYGLNPIIFERSMLKHSPSVGDYETPISVTRSLDLMYKSGFEADGNQDCSQPKSAQISHPYSVNNEIDPHSDTPYKAVTNTNEESFCTEGREHPNSVIYIHPLN